MARRKVLSRSIVYAVKLAAPNDRSGNPRRGWDIYAKNGWYWGFVDEGYHGSADVRALFPKVIYLATYSVSASDYNNTRKTHEIEEHGI